MTILSLVIIPMVIVEIIKRIPEIFTAVVEEFKNHWPEMKEAGMEAFENAILGMTDNSIFYKMGEAVGSLIAKALDKIKSFIEEFKKMGQAIMDGLISGIKDKIQAVTDTIGNVAGAVSGAFKTMLGIASPSKVFEQYGKFLDEGLAEGITGNLQIVNGAMGGLSTAVTGGLSVEAAGAGGGGDIICPIYIGNEYLDTAIIKAIDRANYTQGGR